MSKILESDNFAKKNSKKTVQSSQLLLSNSSVFFPAKPGSVAFRLSRHDLATFGAYL